MNQKRPLSDQANTTTFTRLLTIKVRPDVDGTIIFTGKISLQKADYWLNISQSTEKGDTSPVELFELTLTKTDVIQLFQQLQELETVVEPMINGDTQGSCFYDYDQHIMIDLSQELTILLKRWSSEGMTLEKLAEKTNLKPELIDRVLQI